MTMWVPEKMAFPVADNQRYSSLMAIGHACNCNIVAI